MAETEFLARGTLDDAAYDGTLPAVASTYDPGSDRLYPGLRPVGPRTVDFAPILKLGSPPLNDVVRQMLDHLAEALAGPVEIEFAAVLGAGDTPARFGFLQVRPMAVSTTRVMIADAEWEASNVVVASTHALGNTDDASVTDIVYVRPDRFEKRHTRQIAQEIARRNDALLDEGRAYVLIGFGRWGSSDPWLGIPVEWGDIAGARVIVEATLPSMDVEASQGAHFFHNLSAFEVSYLTVPHTATPGVDWAWLDTLPAVAESELLRHVRTDRPVTVKVDGYSGRGAVWRAA